MIGDADRYTGLDLERPRCSYGWHGVRKQDPRIWQRWALIERSTLQSGDVVELRRCPSCGSAVGKRFPKGVR